MKQELFYNLLEPVHPQAEAFSRKLAGNKEDGDDLYQECLLKALIKFKSLRESTSFKPWLFRIIVNGYKNRLRKAWWFRHQPLSKELTETLNGGDPSGMFTARRWLERAFEVLKPEEKVLVILFELEQWPIEELAQMLNRPPGTIKARLSRARKKMRIKIASYMKTETHDIAGDRLCVAAKPNNE